MFGLRADRLVLKNLGRQYGQNTRIFRRSARRADDHLSLVGWKVLQDRFRAVAVDGAGCVYIDFADSHCRVLRGTVRRTLKFCSLIGSGCCSALASRFTGTDWDISRIIS
jgi:hypothetical protein